MRHVNRYKAGGFGTEAAGAQGYALVAVLQGKANLIEIGRASCRERV